MTAKSISLHTALLVTLFISLASKAATNHLNAPTACERSLRIATKNTKDLEAARSNLANTIGIQVIKQQTNTPDKRSWKYKKNFLSRTWSNYQRSKKGKKVSALIAKTSPDGKSLNVPAYLVPEAVIGQTIVGLIHKGEFKYVNTQKALKSKFFDIRQKVFKEHSQLPFEEQNIKIKEAISAEKQAIEASKTEQQKHIEAQLNILDGYQSKLLNHIIQNKNLEHELALVNSQLGIKEQLKSWPIIGYFFRESISSTSSTNTHEFLTPHPYKLVTPKTKLSLVDIFLGKSDPNQIKILPYEKAVDLTQQETTTNSRQLKEREKELKHKLKRRYILRDRAAIEIEYQIALKKTHTILDQLLAANEIARNNNVNFPELNAVIGQIRDVTNRNSYLEPSYDAQNHFMTTLLEAQKKKTISKEFADDLIGSAVQYANLVNGKDMNDKAIETEAKSILQKFGLDFDWLTSEKASLSKKVIAYRIATGLFTLTATGTIGGNQYYNANENAISAVAINKNIEEGNYMQLAKDYFGKGQEGISELWSTWVTHERRIFQIVTQVEGDNILKDHKTKSKNGQDIINDYLVKKYPNKPIPELKADIEKALKYFKREFDRRYFRAKEIDNFQAAEKRAFEQRKLQAKQLTSKFRKASEKESEILENKVNIISTTLADTTKMSPAERTEWRDKLVNRIENWTSRFYKKETLENQNKFNELLSNLIQKKGLDPYQAIIDNSLKLPESMHAEALDWMNEIIEFSHDYKRFEDTVDKTGTLRKVQYKIEDFQKWLGSWI